MDNIPKFGRILFVDFVKHDKNLIYLDPAGCIDEQKM